LLRVTSLGLTTGPSARPHSSGLSTDKDFIERSLGFGCASAALLWGSALGGLPYRAWRMRWAHRKVFVLGG
jgi:hypothetical protein